MSHTAPTTAGNPACSNIENAMSSYDYQTADNIGRTVEVTQHTFTDTRVTVYADGSRSSSTSIHPS